MGCILRFVVHVNPMGKPRMTQQDKWRHRKCVDKYYAYKNRIRNKLAAMKCMGIKLPEDPHTVSWVAYFDIPKSWSLGKKRDMAGRKHRQKPDRDNVDKGILDALFDDDAMVSDGEIMKRWDDGNGPRIEITIDSR